MFSYLVEKFLKTHTWWDLGYFSNTLLESFGITTCNKIYKCSQLVLKSFLENVLGKFSSLSSFKSITLEIIKFKLIKNNFKSG